ncbi:uncharacterized protein LOC126811595 [Patella vulgata]|uniref:uncharacterized protein LOC126811595 n=1 Tax=Patella vulgata TaxID=6465 RepID=UPI0021802A55|nr:uncharacterized protein LOC126811595 [Patella vulgata]
MISLTDLLHDNNYSYLNAEFLKKTLDDAMNNEMSMDFEELINSMGASQQSVEYHPSEYSYPEKEPLEIVKSQQIVSDEFDAQINIETTNEQPLMNMDATQIDLDQFLGMLGEMTSSSNDHQTSNSEQRETPSPMSNTSMPVSQASPPEDLKPKEHKSTTKHTTNIPRHLRESHIRAERKRQSKIKGAREQLKELLGLPRASENKIVEKAVERCQSLKAELVRLDKESSRLKTEKEALIADIDMFQRNLPATGVVPLTCGTSLTGLYEKHMAVRTQNDPKYSVFERFMKPLFQSYIDHVGNTTSSKEFQDGVLVWNKQNLTLSFLRPVISDGLLDLVRNSNLSMHGPVIKASTKRQS